jgi:hypothetical protein
VVEVFILDHLHRHLILDHLVLPLFIIIILTHMVMVVVMEVAGGHMHAVIILNTFPCKFL